MILWNREARRKRKAHEIPRETWTRRICTLLHSNKATWGQASCHTQDRKNGSPFLNGLTKLTELTLPGCVSFVSDLGDETGGGRYCCTAQGGFGHACLHAE